MTINANKLLAIILLSHLYMYRVTYAKRVYQLLNLQKLVYCAVLAQQRRLKNETGIDNCGRMCNIYSYCYRWYNSYCLLTTSYQYLFRIVISVAMPISIWATAEWRLLMPQIAIYCNPNTLRYTPALEMNRREEIKGRCT